MIRYKETYRGARVVAAEDAHQELLRIQETAGEITPKNVVDHSREPSNVLHPVFEWDDHAAAENFRRAQARGLIRGIELVVQEREAEPEQKVMAFHLVEPEGQNRQYMPTEAIIQDRDLYADALRRLMLNLQALQHSVDELVAHAPKGKVRKARKLADAVSRAASAAAQI